MTSRDNDPIAPLAAPGPRVLQMATLAAYEQDIAEAQAS